jgi:hypothetical protein
VNGTDWTGAVKVTTLLAELAVMPFKDVEEAFTAVAKAVATATEVDPLFRDALVIVRPFTKPK